VDKKVIPYKVIKGKLEKARSQCREAAQKELDEWNRKRIENLMEARMRESSIKKYITTKTATRKSKEADNTFYGLYGHQNLREVT
jgi:hypothetical protein